MMAALKITRDELLALNPCDGDARLALFGPRKSLTAAQALKAGVSIRDVLRAAEQKGRKDLCVRFALLAAQRIALFDKSGTAQPCLDAANTYAADPSAANLSALRKKYAAVRAANAAANAAVRAAVVVPDGLYSFSATAAAEAAATTSAAANFCSAAANAADFAVIAAADRQAEREAQKALLIEVLS